jgi:hypothetical protein
MSVVVWMVVSWSATVFDLVVEVTVLAMSSTYTLNDRSTMVPSMGLAAMLAEASGWWIPFTVFQAPTTLR